RSAHAQRARLRLIVVRAVRRLRAAALTRGREGEALGRARRGDRLAGDDGAHQAASLSRVPPGPRGRDGGAHGRSAGARARRGAHRRVARGRGSGPHVRRTELVAAALLVALGLAAIFVVIPYAVVDAPASSRLPPAF